MHLRRATAADLELLQHWARQPHVIAGISEDDWGWEVELLKTPKWREQLIAAVAWRPVGFVQIIDPAREAAVWTFVRMEGIEPTNNRAERQLRHAVLWRKVRFGTQSERVSRFVASMLTVLMSCQQQSRNALSYLTACCQAFMRTAPFLLLSRNLLVILQFNSSPPPEPLRL